MNEFVEECRREWKRLGVSDPIANEMALDLTSDIEEAEAEGGSAEDVLGNSLFDPHHFAASWARARGVTDPLASSESRSPREQDRQAWLRPIAMAASVVVVLFAILAGAALVVGRHGAAEASVSRIVALPRFARAPGRIVVTPPFHYSMLRPFLVQGGTPLFALASVILVLAVVAVGLALLFRTYGFRRGPGRRLR